MSHDPFEVWYEERQMLNGERCAKLCEGWAEGNDCAEAIRSQP
jgi:hypothetical protein